MFFFFFRNHGVDKIQKLDKSSDSNQWVYIIQSSIDTIKCVCDKINARLQENDKTKYYIIFVPCELVSMEILLEEEGIHGLVKTFVFQWELIPLDGNMLSLEFPDLFRMLFVNEDTSFLSALGRSLWSIQHLFGKIPLVLAHGRFSPIICKMIDIFMTELGPPDKLDPEIGCMIIVDRDIDFASALLTSVTYTGLLDEVFGIKCGAVEFDKRTTGNENTVSYQLSSDDHIYNEIKFKHFSEVYATLSTRVKELHSEFERRRDMKIGEIKEYIATQLQQSQKTKRSLSYHIGACEAIIDEMAHQFEALQNFEQNMLQGKCGKDSLLFLENGLLTRSFSKLTYLRLVCLMALTQNGLNSDTGKSFMHQFMLCHGYEYYSMFQNLVKLGLFTRSDSLSDGNFAGAVANLIFSSTSGKGNFQNTVRKLKLFPEVTDLYDLKHPKDMSYVFSGAYIPVVCQFVHLLIQKKVPFEDILKILPGWHVSGNPQDFNKFSPRTILVYFVGGATYAEIAAFHLLEKITGTKILVAGTSIINGKNIVESAMCSISNAEKSNTLNK